jgi:hypothetical protein
MALPETPAVLSYVSAFSQIGVRQLSHAVCEAWMWTHAPVESEQKEKMSCWIACIQCGISIAC